MNGILNTIWDSIGEATMTLDDDTFHTAYRELILEYETSKTMEQFNSFENNFRFEVHFKPIDYKNVFEHYQKNLEELRLSLTELFGDVFDDEDTDDLALDMLGEEARAYLDNSLEYKRKGKSSWEIVPYQNTSCLFSLLFNHLNESNL